MTHTLHRRGTKGSLSEDFIALMIPARGFNSDNSEEKLRQIWAVIANHAGKMVNFGDMRNGNSHTVALEDLQKANSSICHAVFKSRRGLKGFLAEMRERDFGISVVVSGIFEEVAAVCAEVGLKPHTIEHSFGVHGKLECLPSERDMQVITMCGHAMVSRHLLKSQVEKIQAGKTTCGKAAAELSRQCVCGIFNPYRAEKLLERLAAPD
jgi:hypothetical protein